MRLLDFPTLAVVLVLALVSPTAFAWPADAQVGEIFADGFEQGSTCAWSTIVTGPFTGHCLIDGACFDPLQSNPLVPCEHCDPINNSEVWTPAPIGTVCEPASCIGFDSQPADLCDGSGTCIDGGLVFCAPYICDPVTGLCPTFCSEDSECQPTNFCNESTFACEPKLPQGAPCWRDGVCQSGICDGGFCL